jgi:hypothetical protein
MRAFPAVWLRTILAVFGLWAASAGATIIEFTYTGGPGTACPTCSATGIGSFSFADSPTSVGLGDLTAFSLLYTLTDSSVPVTGTFTYSLADLISFSATLDSSQDVTALAFETSFVGSDTPLTLLPESVTVTSLANAETKACAPPKAGGCNGSVQITSGSVTAAAIPEPATIFLLMLGVSGLLGHFFSRRGAS